MMKHLYNIMITALMTCSLVACSSDDPTYESPAKIKITSADVVFMPGGGTNQITTEASGTLTATSSSSWLTIKVNGSNLELTAQPNTGLQTRTAIINLSANGAVATLTAQQKGLIIDMNVHDNYQFNDSDNQDSIINNNSNVDFEVSVSDSWIKVLKTKHDFAVSVEDNASNDFRVGSVTLKFADYKKDFKVIQWGKEYPFTSLNTATYTDGEGNEQSKSITVVKDNTKEGAYLVKGLVPEGDIQVLTNSSKKGEFYIPSGYLVGTKVKTDGTTVYLRCMISAANVNTGGRYWSTTITNTATSAYRMSMGWAVDSNSQATLSYTRNSTLSSTYSTDGIIVARYKKATGAAASNRDGSGDESIEYYLLGLTLSKQ